MSRTLHSRVKSSRRMCAYGWAGGGLRRCRWVRRARRCLRDPFLTLGKKRKLRSICGFFSFLVFFTALSFAAFAFRRVRAPPFRRRVGEFPGGFFGEEERSLFF